VSDLPEPTIEQRLSLLLRGVQRMADALGGVDERLQELAGRVEADRGTAGAELAEVGARVDRLQGDVARSLAVVTAVGRAVDAALQVAAPPADATAELAVEHLTEAVRALRDDLASAWAQLREQTADAVDRVAGEQAERTLRLLETVSETRRELLDALAQAPGPGESPGELEAALQQLRQVLDGRHVVLTEGLAAVSEQLRSGLAGLRADVVQRLDELPAPPAPPDDTSLRESLAALADDLRALQGEVEASAGQLRTDVGARQAQLRDEVVAAVREELAGAATGGRPDDDDVTERLARIEAALRPVDLAPVLDRLAALEARLEEVAGTPPTPPADLGPVAERLAAIEWRMGEVLDPLRDRLAGVEWRLGEALDPIRERLSAHPGPDQPDDILGRLATIEASLASLRRDLSVELESVAADTRRGVDRIVGEVRSVDERVGGMADDLRVVRQLRDGLQDLLDGVDATRQLAARAATSQQMAEVTRELGSVLAEIESARSQVLRVERGPQPAQQAQVVDVEVDRLGRRIEQLAEVIEERLAAEPEGAKEGEVALQVVERLRHLGAGARQLGNGVLEDLRARRKR
jgi:hypothetical protein